MGVASFRTCFTAAVAAAGFFLSAAGQTYADVLTFDDVTEESWTRIPDGYGGLNWTDLNVLRPQSERRTGYTNGVVSGDYVAYNPFSAVASASAGSYFTFQGAYLTAAWNYRLNITVDGYRDGELIYTETVVVSPSEPTWFDFDYCDIDTLSFTSFGGVNAGLGRYGTHFAMDDFTFNFNEAPEVSVATDVESLGSSNKKMVPVEILVTASDDCTGPDDLIVLCDIESSQADDSNGRGKNTGDVNGEDGYSSPVPVELTHVGGGTYVATVELRAERDSGEKTSRTYTIHVTVLDGVGNLSEASTAVVVPAPGGRRK
ncbi:hypothetical protein [Alienimonas chondri]|uniref:Uncharacterized protein n=1 Tax=Alienimonas chondri TaxID=2681879 RepID=A0ABX1VH38_9PLAN|nr:hypothetical protein [Alienimonas chondri]NNJ27386.1 hypothetical protein [Alienimonas chondri]